MLSIKINEDEISCTYSDGRVKTKIMPYKGNLDKLHEDMMNVDYNDYYRSRPINKASILEKVRLPEIGRIYYFCLFQFERIPTVQELVNSYIKSYCQRLQNGKMKLNRGLGDYYTGVFSEDEIIGRICRSYNSFNREFELLCQIRLTEGFRCYYDMNIDFYDGIDLVVEHNGKYFGVRSYLDNNRSNSFVKRKTEYRHDYNNNKLISVKYPLKMSGYDNNAIFYNDIACYEPYDVSEFLKKIAA